MYKKNRKTNKSPAIQAVVLSKRASGDSKNKIARDLKIHPETVSHILSQDELEQFVQQGKSIIFNAIPRVSAAYSAKAEEKFEDARTFLERAQVIPSAEGSNGVTLNNFIGIGSLNRPDTRKPVLQELPPA